MWRVKHEALEQDAEEPAAQEEGPASKANQPVPEARPVATPARAPMPATLVKAEPKQKRQFTRQDIARGPRLDDDMNIWNPKYT